MNAALVAEHRAAEFEGKHFNAYRVAVEKHVVPALGGHRLDRLMPAQLERGDSNPRER